MSTKSAGDCNSGYSGLQFMRKAEEEVLRRAADKRKFQSSKSAITTCSDANDQLSPPLPLLSFTSLNGKQDATIPQTIIGTSIIK
jgi:hypothetical protein